MGPGRRPGEYGHRFPSVSPVHDFDVPDGLRRPAAAMSQPSAARLVRIVDRFPDLLALHRRSPERYPSLLESVGGSGRFDVLFAFPGEELRLDASGGVSIGMGGERRRPDAPEGASGFLSALDAWAGRLWTEGTAPDGIPFHGGWFLYLSYEFSREIEPRLATAGNPPVEGIVASARRFPAAIVRDHLEHRCILVTETPEAAEYLDLMEEDLRGLRTPPCVFPGVEDVVEEDPALFMEAVERALAYIRDGDVFQVNLSRRWTARLGGDDAPDVDAIVYERLRRSNPGPFAGLARLGDGHVVMSSSPERLVRVHEGRVSTRPIAGTRPRASSPEADRRLAERLMAHPKERAEHVMLIDLERNDLGRICRPGTVEVDEFMALESYRHVHHIVSNVSGRLREGIGPAAVVGAVFPGGTITGCPKVRCMEIIAELETGPRAAYTGSMGYLNRDGSMDLNILIRTLERRGEELGLRAGAGIVADSEPWRELDETRAKARGLLLALRER